MQVGDELLVVTFEGECFGARLRHKEYNPERSSLATFWVLEDRVWERPNLGVVAFLPDETRWQLPERAVLDRDLLALNGVRRAFDCGELHFDDNASQEGPQKEVIVLLNPAGLERHFAVDTRIKSLILHRAYWEGFKYNPTQDRWLDFATDTELEYIGADRNAIQRNVWRLGEIGLLKLHPTEKTMAIPKNELIDDYESGASIGNGQIEIFPADSQRESCNKIKKLLESAKSSLTVADNYIDGSILGTLSAVPQRVRIRILTEHVSPDFTVAIERFLARHQMALEVRTHAKRIHDRFVVVDDSKAYALGASIKDAGKKLWHLHRLDDRLQLAKLKNFLGAEWDSAAAVWPPH
jgi:hypothetical protein